MLYNDILDQKEKIAIVGLGYVGMPLAIEFSKYVDVIGFDIDENKIENYLNGIDVTKEVGDENLKRSKVDFTSDESKLKEAKFYIVAVPTPINEDNSPNLKLIIDASKIIGRNMTKGSIIVYESTVYPGITEDICAKVLEEASGLKYMSDFKVGYSPERINPGDKINRLSNIVKIVSGCDKETLEEIANTYEIIIKAGVYKANNIKIAEAAKVIENTQRDINIAFMNELSMIFEKMDIDTKLVLEACKTKWNFIDFKPGLVGGNCIGVDPYYLVYKAKEVGVDATLISQGRKINDSMGYYVAMNIIKQLIDADKKIKQCKVGIFGITFKENCPDCSYTKVVDIINTLKEYSINVKAFDNCADENYVKTKYNISLSKIEEMKDFDAIVFAVCHDEFRNLFTLENIKNMYSEGTMVLIDVKAIFSKEEAEKMGYLYWRL